MATQQEQRWNSRHRTHHFWRRLPPCPTTTKQWLHVRERDTWRRNPSNTRIRIHLRPRFATAHTCLPASQHRRPRTNTIISSTETPPRRDTTPKRRHQSPQTTNRLHTRPPHPQNPHPRPREARGRRRFLARLEAHQAHAHRLRLGRGNDPRPQRPRPHRQRRRLAKSEGSAEWCRRCRLAPLPLRARGFRARGERSVRSGRGGQGSCQSAATLLATLGQMAGSYSAGDCHPPQPQQTGQWAFVRATAEHDVGPRSRRRGRRGACGSRRAENRAEAEEESR